MAGDNNQSVFDMIGDFTTAIIGAVITTLFGSFMWLVRTVLTNNRKIAVLEAEAREREKFRHEEAERLKTIHEDMRELRASVSQLLAKG